MSLKKVVFVSHCVLNTASKVVEEVKSEVSEEEICRKKLLYKAIEEDIHIIQLPCPEFNLYGSRRWGHVKEQFDNPFYRDSCKKMLESYILQIQEYAKESNMFKILGVVGIEGSPSCGVNLTYCGTWGGELSSNPNLSSKVKEVYPKKEKGVFIEVLQELLKEKDLRIKFVGLNDFEEIIEGK